MVKVDPEDEWLLYILPWRISTKGYIEATMYDGAWRKTVKLHHFIMGTPIWEGEFIDHINRDKQDCRRENLRWVDVFVSNQNRDYVEKARHISHKKSGYEVRFTRNGVVVQVGTFQSMQEAIDARDHYARLHSIVQISDGGRQSPANA